PIGSGYVIERDIERGRGVRERADADAVHAGFGDGSDVGKRDAAGGFQKNPVILVTLRVAAHYSLGKFAWGHVVQHDNIRRERECFVKLLEVLHLDFDRNRWSIPASSFNSCSNRRRFFFEGGQMVVLDKDAVIEAYPMIVAPALTDGVFFEQPPTWRG